MTREDISALLLMIPELNYFGIGLPQSGRGQSKVQQEAQHRQRQDEICNSEAICNKVCEWLSTKKRIATINNHHSSYGLKHMVEQDLGEYVSNGVFIAAAIHCGFPYKIVTDSPNVYFGISEKSLNCQVGV